LKTNADDDDDDDDDVADDDDDNADDDANGYDDDDVIIICLESYFSPILLCCGLGHPVASRRWRRQGVLIVAEQERHKITYKVYEPRYC